MLGAREVFALIIRTVSRKLSCRKVRCLAQYHTALIEYQSPALNPGVSALLLSGHSWPETERKLEEGQRAVWVAVAPAGSPKGMGTADLDTRSEKAWRVGQAGCCRLLPKQLLPHLPLCPSWGSQSLAPFLRWVRGGPQ